jgi:hypothetical protein
MGGFTIHQQCGVRRGAVEVRVSHDGPKLPSASKKQRGVQRRVRRIRVHSSEAEGTDQFAAAKQIHVAVELAARLVPGPDRISIASRGLSGRAKRVLHCRVHLPLQLQEVRYREILGFEPSQDHLVVAHGAGEMNVIVAGQPFVASAAGPVFHLHGDGTALARAQFELDASGSIEKAAERFEPVLSRG